MLARIWGCRGSMASPGPATVRYGGNTSCLELEVEGGDAIVLDAGTGIRELGDKLLRAGRRRIHLFLSHLHMDHVEGLGFFGPLWSEDVEIDVWGPPSPTMSLAERLGRYLSPPLFPIQLNDIPSVVRFRDMSDDAIRIGPVEMQAARVEHPGPTLGYRITANDRVLTYIPDHEPARVTKVEDASPDWLPGADLAFGADVLLHDAQYWQAEYEQRRAWGHSSVDDAVSFARVSKADRLVMFHHDPSHSDEELVRLESKAADHWGRHDGDPPVLAREGMEIALTANGVTVG